MCLTILCNINSGECERGAIAFWGLGDGKDSYHFTPKEGVDVCLARPISRNCAHEICDESRQ